MKLAWTIFIATICGAVLAIVPWLLTFRATSLPPNPEQWSAFGSYVGGLLSPFIAALALIAFLKTVSQQQEQIEQLRLQGAKEDLWRAITKIESDYEQVLKGLPVTVKVGDKTYGFTAMDVVARMSFLAYQSAMVNEADLKRALAEHDGNLPRDHPSIASFETFGMAAGHLNQLRLFVEKHDEIAHNNALTKYFYRKHKLAYDRLLERGFLKDKWQVDS